MKNFIIKCLMNMAGIYTASLLFPSIVASSAETIFMAGLVLGLINLLVRPFLLLIALPINLITLGLFTLIINASLVKWTAYLLNGLNIPTFVLALATAFIISAFQIISDRLLRD